MTWFTQAQRFLQLETVEELGLMLISFGGTESISEPFGYELTMMSDNTNIAAPSVVGRLATVTLSIGESATPRYFNGYLHHFQLGEIVQGTRYYRAQLKPWLWFLNYSSDCRIFQGKTVPEIAENVFESFGFTQFDTQGLSRDYASRDYCVQYRETALHFISRLFEEEGIFYYFQQGNGKHKLMLGDNPAALKPAQDSQAEYTKRSGKNQYISRLKRHYQFYTGKVARRDYNPATPETLLPAEDTHNGSLPQVLSYEQFDYPGLYANSHQGQALAIIRQEAESLNYDRLMGASNYAGFSAGGTVSISGAPNEQDDGDYAFIQVTHMASDESYLHDASGEGSQSYSNTFTAIPASTTYRSVQLHGKPRVYGAQTAVVTGGPGEELETSHYGQVKVQFHWDRQGENNEYSSCWLRVAQLWAGNNWGVQFMPRIGQEVLVHFLEGDPDRPLIMGTLYNGDNLPPYALPGLQTQSGIKTHSTKDAGPNDYNELRFEDKKDHEEIFIQAQRDFNQTIKHNLSVTVANDHGHQTSHDSTVTIGNDYTHTTVNNSTMTVGNDAIQTTNNNLTEIVGNSYTQTIQNFSETRVGNTAFIGAMQSIVLQVGTTSITLTPTEVVINTENLEVN